MMRARLVAFSLALMALAAHPSYAPRMEIANTYDLDYGVADKVLSEEGGYGVGGQASIQPPGRGNESLRAEPRYRSRRLYRGFVHLERGNDRDFALVLDAAGGEGPPYDRLYLDANNDEDLTNDSAIEAASVQAEEGGSTNSYFPPVTLDLPEADGGPYAVAVTSYYVKKCSGCGREHSYAYVRSACYWEGEARFGDHDCRVVLLDGDCNGLFNERNPSTVGDPYGYGGDQLLVLTDGAGRGAGPALTAALLARSVPLGRYVAVGNSFYEIRPAANGASLQVYNREIPTGPVRVNAQDYRLQFVGADGPVVVQSSSPEARLPLGKYLLREQAILRTDDEGRLWVVETSARAIITRAPRMLGERTIQSRYGVFEVTADSGPEIPAFGPPFVLSVSARPEDGEVYISLSLQGERGDRVSDVQVDGRRPPAPAFRIVSAAGTVIAQDQFEYG